MYEKNNAFTDNLTTQLLYEISFYIGTFPHILKSRMLHPGRSCFLHFHEVIGKSGQMIGWRRHAPLELTPHSRFTRAVVGQGWCKTC